MGDGGLWVGSAGASGLWVGTIGHGVLWVASVGYCPVGRLCGGWCCGLVVWGMVLWVGSVRERCAVGW